MNMIKEIIENIINEVEEVVVPTVEISVCADCNGTGRNLPEQTCPTCNGTGK